MRLKKPVPTKPPATHRQRYNVHRNLPSAGQPSPSLEPAVKPPKSLWRKALRAGLLLIAALLAVGLIWNAINLSRAGGQVFGSGSLLSYVFSDDPRGSQRGRVNILLTGYSADDPGHPGAKLTDSIMVLSLNTRQHTGYMLSVPRDLYVQLGGLGYRKINEAYIHGGIKLLKDTVSQKLAIPIDYFAVINYAAVRDTVNALGGVTVQIKSPDKRGLYDPNISKADGGPLKLPNGANTIDGQTALNLTRARGDHYLSYGFPMADFDRTQHQRQVLLAIKDRLGWGLVLNPLKNGRFFSAIGSHVRTNIPAAEVRPLFGLFNKIGLEDLKSYSLNKIGGQNLLASYAAPGGLSALRPAAGLDDFSQVQAAIRKLNQR